MKTVLVTGGAGFIGSCYVLSRRTAGERVVNLDKLTYCGNIGNFHVEASCFSAAAAAGWD